MSQVPLMSQTSDKSVRAPRRSHGKGKASGSPAGQAGRRLAPSRALPAATVAEKPLEIAYGPKTEFNLFIRRVSDATPMEIVLTERAGVHAKLIKDLSKHMAIPASRLFAILGVPKATAEKKVAAGEMVAGQAGRRRLGTIEIAGYRRGYGRQQYVRRCRSSRPGRSWWSMDRGTRPSLGGRKPA